MTPRFIILNCVAVAVLALMWIGGLLDKALSGSNGIAIAVVGSALLIGLGTIASGHIKMAKRIKTHITKVGLCGTVLGFILALSSIDPTQDTAARIAGVLTGMGLALYVTLSGLLANLWLIINLVLLGHDDG